MAENHQKDQLLIQSIRQGDKLSYRELFDRYYEAMFITALQMLKDESTAKDVVQEVFFEIWKKRESLDIKSSIGGYLKRSVINRSLNQIKSRKPFVEDKILQHNSSIDPSAQEILEADDLQAAVQKGLDSLPDRCRTIFILKRMEGYSLKEIGEKLDISPKTVEHQITKALKVLKQAVAPILKKNTS